MHAAQPAAKVKEEKASRGHKNARRALAGVMGDFSQWYVVAGAAAVAVCVVGALVARLSTASAQRLSAAWRAPAAAALPLSGDAAAAPERSVLLVTAHPDDECMFFAPSVAALRRAGLRVLLLCLSTGDAQGLGRTRARELRHAAAVMGIDAETDVACVDDPLLRDGMDTQWATGAVAAHVKRCVAAWEANGSCADHTGDGAGDGAVGDARADAGGVRRLLVDKVLTFDEGGVSGHGNHAACARGATAAAAELGIPTLQLVTTSWLRKYGGVADAALSALDALLRGDELCVSTPVAAHRAMQQHRTQYVWWRRAYVVLSRYTTLNTLRRVA